MFASWVTKAMPSAIHCSMYQGMALKTTVCSLYTYSHIPTLSADMKSLSAVLNPSDIKKHNTSVIMLHGLGDTGFFMVPYAADLSRSFPTVRFLCPTAHLIHITAREKAEHHAWYDFPSWDKEGNNKSTGVEESRVVVETIINKEIARGVDPKRIVVCGFSQGAGMAFHAGLNQSTSLGGVISLCGCLPNDNTFTVSEGGKKTPVLMFHGTADTHVPYQFIQEIDSLLKAKGVEHVELNLYPGVKHKITRRMMDNIRLFLDKIVKS